MIQMPTTCVNFESVSRYWEELIMCQFLFLLQIRVILGTTRSKVCYRLMKSFYAWELLSLK